MEPASNDYRIYEIAGGYLCTDGRGFGLFWSERTIKEIAGSEPIVSLRPFLARATVDAYQEYCARQLN
jgi:hypothetical protein